MSDLRTRIAQVLASTVCTLAEHSPCAECTEAELHVADTVVDDLTKYLPPIFASAIHAYADSQLAALSHHGHPEAIWELNRLNQHAANIANYATTHEKWNGNADDE